MPRRKVTKSVPDPKASTVSTPSGGQATRCSATTRGGDRCKMPARRGFTVCFKHGAGSRVREEEGRSRPAGRPPTHGLYARATQASIRERTLALEEAQVDLDNTDHEMRTMKAVFAFLIDQASDYLEVLDRVVARLRASLPESHLAEADSQLVERIAETLMAGRKLQAELASWSLQLLDGGRKVVQAARDRAFIRARTAEERALQTLGKFAVVIRYILADILDEEQLDLFEGRLKKEVFEPNGIKIDPADSSVLGEGAGMEA